MRRWFVTGVSSGFGRAIAQAALAEGDIVCGTVRKDADAETFAALDAERAVPVVMDVTDPASVTAAVAKAEQVMGAIDVLVNNAGRGFTGAIEESSIAEAQSLFDTNFFGPMRVIQAALPAMRARGSGVIANVTSVSGLAAWHGTGMYGATKFAFECLGRTLAQEVGPLGITAINVAPGSLRTEFASASLARAEATIDDYAQTAHIADVVLREKTGGEAGDPAKAAQALLKAMAADTPPGLLLLGEDAYHYAEFEIERLQGDMDAWREVGTSIAYDS